jgi:hypothetical protein
MSGWVRDSFWDNW